MPAMYFSGVDSNEITSEVSCRYISIDPDLCYRILCNDDLNARVFLDTPLLRFRDRTNEQIPFPRKVVSKSNASVGLVNMPSLPIVVYTSRALINAEFREITTDEFKDTYVVPLDVTLRESKPTGDYSQEVMVIHWDMKLMLSCITMIVTYLQNLKDCSEILVITPIILGGHRF